MNRAQFRKMFKTSGPVVLPVIHVLDKARTARNITAAVQCGVPGCFLINHDFAPDQFLPIIRDARARFPSLWLGVNFLGVTGRIAFPMLGELHREGTDVDAYWADDACIDEFGNNKEAEDIAAVYRDCGWSGLYFGGTCFKKQREVSPEHYTYAAREACAFMDVVTTSGVATGQQPDTRKVATFRAAIGNKPLALASGITPQNAAQYTDADCFMVATGINEPRNFYDIDPGRLDALMQVCRELQKEPDIDA